MNAYTCTTKLHFNVNIYKFKTYKSMITNWGTAMYFNSVTYYPLFLHSHHSSTIILLTCVNSSTHTLGIVCTNTLMLYEVRMHEGRIVILQARNHIVLLNQLQYLSLVWISKCNTVAPVLLISYNRKKSIQTCRKVSCITLIQQK